MLSIGEIYVHGFIIEESESMLRFIHLVIYYFKYYIDYHVVQKYIHEHDIVIVIHEYSTNIMKRGFWDERPSRIGGLSILKMGWDFRDLKLIENIIVCKEFDLNTYIIPAIGVIVRKDPLGTRIVVVQTNVFVYIKGNIGIPP